MGADNPRPQDDLARLIVRAGGTLPALGTATFTDPIAIYGYAEVSYWVRFTVDNVALTRLDVRFEQRASPADDYTPILYEIATVGGGPGDVDVGPYVVRDGTLPVGAGPFERLYVVRLRGGLTTGEVRASLTPAVGVVTGGDFVSVFVSRRAQY